MALVYRSPQRGERGTEPLTSEISRFKTQTEQNYLGKFYIRCKILTAVQETLKTELRQATPHLELPHGILRQRRFPQMVAVAILLQGDGDRDGGWCRHAGALTWQLQRSPRDATPGASQRTLLLSPNLGWKEFLSGPSEKGAWLGR